ncbi:LOW QUALITY PROTEIN: hypothetical protein PHMEG_00032200 [Phytophthora megakarya]|uniref:Reverse transcriptase domain-containing protein n=1 Tax=Phytophthora megakarya TaxID=4795 RepID=A0A225UWV4_9STRA|nr:LOW QUALITY PROTEIN: hypothetical protein PHMEG_00032200 [Phytophthora megakarya]
MCIDSRAVNALTIPMQWPMLRLDVGITHVAGAKRNVYSNVPMGAKDAVVYFQSIVEQIFGYLLYNRVLVWLDDILNYAESEEELMELLEEVLLRCETFGSKLHPGKCKFFLKEVTWCGKIISENGVTHSPERVQGYVNTFKRGGITTVHMCRQLDEVKYSRFCTSHVSVERNFGVMQLQGARTKKRLQKVDYSELEVQSLAQAKTKPLAMVPPAHPNDNWEVAMVTDATEELLYFNLLQKMTPSHFRNSRISLWHFGVAIFVEHRTDGQLLRKMHLP